MDFVSVFLKYPALNASSRRSEFQPLQNRRRAFSETGSGNRSTEIAGDRHVISVSQAIWHYYTRHGFGIYYTPANLSLIELEELEVKLLPATEVP
jgi:hypothetical protein